MVGRGGKVLPAVGFLMVISALGRVESIWRDATLVLTEAFVLFLVEKSCGIV